MEEFWRILQNWSFNDTESCCTKLHFRTSPVCQKIRQYILHLRDCLKNVRSISFHWGSNTGAHYSHISGDISVHQNNSIVRSNIETQNFRIQIGRTHNSKFCFYESKDIHDKEFVSNGQNVIGNLECVLTQTLYVNWKITPQEAWYRTIHFSTKASLCIKLWF